MATEKRGLVDKVKRVVARASTRGAVTLVEGTAAAVRTVDKLQGKLSERGKPGRTRAAAKREPASETKRSTVSRSTVSRANASRGNVSRASVARGPELPAGTRATGRKTMPGAEAAPKRTKAPAGKKPRQGSGFKTKRGQKHPHSGR